MSAEDDPTLHQRIGALTRELHDAMRALGYDRSLSAAAQALPDARDRLAYVATLTGRAAERVLCAVEEAQAEQARIADDVVALLARYSAAAGDGTPAARAELHLRTRELLERVARGTTATREQLHVIMMAQDFHDLSGQVIKRVTEVASKVEASLVDLLVETRPEHAPLEHEGLAGPPIRASSDTVSSQGEVDELLASLGF
jgi:chemotaxis protein CheZ